MSSFKIQKEMIALDNGIVPESMSFKVENDDIIPLIKYESYSREFWINKYDPELLEQFPCLYSLVEKDYEENKGRTALQEMEKIYKISGLDIDEFHAERYREQIIGECPEPSRENSISTSKSTTDANRNNTNELE